MNRAGEAPLTQTEARILRLLSDRRPHARRELLACLPDPDYATPRLLAVHVCRLRTKLPRGHAIYAVVGNGSPGYVLVHRA